MSGKSKVKLKTEVETVQNSLLTIFVALNTFILGNTFTKVERTMNL